MDFPKEKAQSIVEYYQYQCYNSVTVPAVPFTGSIA